MAQDEEIWKETAGLEEVLPAGQVVCPDSV